MGDPRGFYDDLAESYHLIYPDWPASVDRQGRALGALIADRLGPGPRDVYDCACGIGTQAIGLARYGHRVFGSDLSPAAAGRAAREAARRHARVPVVAADPRALPVPGERFDVVLCADNALPHLLTAAELVTGLAEARRALRPAGLFLASVRDYDAVLADRPTATPPTVVEAGTGRVVTFQVWTWHADGERYDVDHLQLHQNADGWSVRHRTTTYWAIRRQRLTELLDTAGLAGARWYEPADIGFFQPIVAAVRP